MSISQVRRVQPASSPTKCGASRMSGCPLSARIRSSPTIFTSRITRSRRPHHRIERSRTLRPKARKCALARSRRSFSVISGKQRERLIRQTLRRSRTRMYSSEPRAEPIGASRASGRKCSVQTTATAIRVSKAGFPFTGHPAEAPPRALCSGYSPTGTARGYGESAAPESG